MADLTDLSTSPIFNCDSVLSKPPNFYMIITESPTMGPIYACWILRKIKTFFRNSVFLVKVQPPFLDDGVGRTEELELIGIARRHKWVFIPTRRNRFLYWLMYFNFRWPIDVHILRLNSSAIQFEENIIQRCDIDPLEWGQLYPSEQSAQRALSLHYKNLEHMNP
jgi:hypothetical protein